MTPNEFRRLALSFADATEAQHMAHPDFRVSGEKIFATLGYPDARFGMLVLTPDAQREAIAQNREVFEPVTGGWGRAWKYAGATDRCHARATSAVDGNRMAQRSAKESHTGQAAKGGEKGQKTPRS